MTDSKHLSRASLLVVNYAVVFLIFGSLYYLAHSTAKPFIVSNRSSLPDWLLIVSIMASTWTIWLSMVKQRCRNCLGLWRLLKTNLGAASILFVISAAIFVISAVKLDLIIPPESNLMDNRNINLVAIYCRIPILSHPILLYILITALTYKLVKSPFDFRKAILVGGLVVFIYYFTMYLCGVGFSALLTDLFVSPQKTPLLLMFIYWLPTLLFALVAYIVYSTAFNAD